MAGKSQGLWRHRQHKTYTKQVRVKDTAPRAAFGLSGASRSRAASRLGSRSRPEAFQSTFKKEGKEESKIKRLPERHLPGHRGPSHVAMCESVPGRILATHKLCMHVAQAFFPRSPPTTSSRVYYRASKRPITDSYAWRTSYSSSVFQ